jgi:hypothetical protein
MNILKTSGTCFEKDESYLKIVKKSELYCIPRTTIQLYDFIKYYANMYNESKDQRYIGIINQTALSFEKEYRNDISKVEKIRLDSLSNILNRRHCYSKLKEMTILFIAFRQAERKLNKEKK